MKLKISDINTQTTSLEVRKMSFVEGGNPFVQKFCYLIITFSVVLPIRTT